MWNRNKNKKDLLVNLFQQNTVSNETNIDFLVNLVSIFRPRDISATKIVDISELLELLDENSDYRNYLKNYLEDILKTKEFDQIISDSGIIKDSDFFHEVHKRAKERLLPEQPPKDTLQYVLNQVFYSNTDPNWIDKIPFDQLERLLIVTGLNVMNESSRQFITTEIVYSLEVLIQRMSGAAMETNVNKMVPEYQNLDSPFIAIQREFAEFSNTLLSSGQLHTTSDDLGYKQVKVLHRQCEKYVNTAFANSHKYGISIKVNQNLLRIRQQLERIDQIINFLIYDSPSELNRKNIEFAKLLIRYNCQKNNLRKLINQSTQLISYEITHHTALTGEHYITNSRKEYFQMLNTAAGGGLIVGILCISKVLLANADTSAFGHAFLYSINYALGFIAIYLAGFTLATKQPAMTAATLISALEQNGKDRNSEDKYRGFAVFFARVFRSQFIAFVGNVLVAFPVAFLLVWLTDQVFDVNIAEKKWNHLITDLSPVHSAAIFHAAIAGVFLFLSGIIAGSIANRDKHDHVYYRIQEHPALKRLLGKERTRRIAAIYEKKWAGIVSNFWFGVFMGSTASIGIFLGLNLDVRHITFASGNLALGIYGGHFDIPLSMIIWGIFGIGIIGLINFLVSFSLSLTLAFKSRNIRTRELRLVVISIWKFFKQQPSHFFFPPKNGSNATIEKEPATP